LRLRPNEFRLLRDLVNAQAGLQFDDDALILFDRRLSERLTALHLSGFDEYYKYLRFNVRGPAELEEVLERVTTNETYFFRQEYQLRAFKNEILPRLYEANASRRRLAIWSAGCSTGEEAYTLAILVHESGLFEGWDLRVIGSDICKQNVAFARRGVYRAGAFRTTPIEYRRSYFTEEEDGIHVAETIRKLCYFRAIESDGRGQSGDCWPCGRGVLSKMYSYIWMSGRRRKVHRLPTRAACSRRHIVLGAFGVSPQRHDSFRARPSFGRSSVP